MFWQAAAYPSVYVKTERGVSPSVLFISKSYAFVATWKKLVVFVAVPKFSGSVCTARHCIFESCFKRLEDVDLNHELVQLVAEVAKLKHCASLFVALLVEYNPVFRRCQQLFSVLEHIFRTVLRLRRTPQRSSVLS